MRAVTNIKNEAPYEDCLIGIEQRVVHTRTIDKGNTINDLKSKTRLEHSLDVRKKNCNQL